MIEIPSDIIPSNLTLSARIKPSAANGMIVGKVSNPASASSDKTNNPDHQFALELRDSKPTISIRIGSNGCSGDAWYTLSLDSPVNLNEWVSIIGTWDSSALKIYINGELKATKTDIPAGSIDDCKSGTVRIGYWLYKNPRFFNGLIDDVHIYDRALSVEEVNQLYTGKPTTTDTSCATPENLGVAKANIAIPVEMTGINLCGGISVNSASKQNKVVQKLSDDVDITATINVNVDSYVGQAADIVVYAIYTPLNSTASLNFMLDSRGVPVLQETPLAAFKSNVTLSKTQTISMYKGKFVGTGRLQVYVGFRLKKDGIVIANSTPIDITINP